MAENDALDAPFRYCIEHRMPEKHRAASVCQKGGWAIDCDLHVARRKDERDVA